MKSEAWAAWAAETLRKGRCEVCGRAPARGERLEGHHVVAQQKIRRAVGSTRVDVLTDLRNHLAACKRCHAGHTTRLRPISRDKVPDAAWEFAAELGLTWLVEKTYPLGSSAVWA